jgi:DNA-binding NarL/FixJ family response regulator
MDALAEALSLQDGLDRFDALISDTDWLFCCDSPFLALSVVYGQMGCAGRHAQRRGARPTALCGGLRGSVTTWAEAMQLLEPPPPRLVVTTERLADGDGAALIQKVKREHPGTACVLILRHPNRARLDQVRGSGADGLLLEPLIARGNLLEALITVLDGGFFVDPDLQVYLESTGQERTPRLTRRELEVLTLASEGLTDKRIALQLKISEDTVRCHLKKVFSKLEVDNRTAAVMRTLQLGLIRTPGK